MIDMNKNNNEITATIANAANGYGVSVDGNPTAYVGNACAAAEIVADYFGESLLYDTLICYLDAGCELIDIERDLTDGLIIINALRNGCNVGEATNEVTPDANPPDLFNALPNLYN